MGSENEQPLKSANPLPKRILQAVTCLWEPPGMAAIMAALFYFSPTFLSGNLMAPSKYPYYNYLADAFLHGQVWFRQIPSTTHDLVYYQGNYSLYQAPLPGFLVAPLVAIFGVGVSDVFYNAVFAVINVALLAHFLRVITRIRFVNLSKFQRSTLVAFFALGTVHLPLAPLGRVWNTALILGFTFTLLAYLAAFSLTGWKAWFFTGLALAAAMLTRNHLVLTGIFPAIYLLSKERPWRWGHVVRNLLIAAVPLLVALAIVLVYNQLRFGNPFDNGVAYHQMASFFQADFEKYGYFNIHYLPTNLYYQFIFYPFPLTEEIAMGGSLFLMSPVFFAAFAAFWKPDNKWITLALLLTILITYLPIGLLMGTGWIQYGPRYTLDITVPLLVLSVLGMQKWKNWLVTLLATISILTYLLGITIWAFIK